MTIFLAGENSVDNYTMSITSDNMMQNDYGVLYQDFIDKLIESEELKRALTVLSQTEKERLLEYHIIGKTLSQIGEEQGCSAAAVKYSVDRAIKKLKKFYNLT